MAGQICLKNTFLRTFYDSPLNFAFLAVSIVIFWVMIIVFTINKRITIRTIIVFGLSALGLLIFQITWQLNNIYNNESLWPQLWPFNFSTLMQSSSWFNALVQVLLSTQIGTGSIPLIIGKLVHKGKILKFKFTLIELY